MGNDPTNAVIVAGQFFPMPFKVRNFMTDQNISSYTQGCSPNAAKCGPGGLPFAAAAGITSLMRYRPRRYGDAKNRTLQWAQGAIRQFVIHLDGLFDADQCFDVLQNERGLSCHFILDHEGTLVQTLDLIDCAYHASGMNETSIGVEICNRGDYTKANEDAYANRTRFPYPRDVVTCNIHNEKYVCFDFTKPQYETMEKLARELTKILPGIKLDYPQITPGEPKMTLVYPDDPANLRLRDAYSGYLGHYHANIQKWDPGPFDFKKFITKLSSANMFPIGLHDQAVKAEVPVDEDKLVAATSAFYDNNEKMGGGGFFPVGPLEGYRLYHGGVHLHAPEGDPVYAPFNGQIVAARNGPPVGTVGSANFVLIKHSINVNAESIDFYTLLMHLKQESPGLKKTARLKWMASDQWSDAEPGRVLVFDKSPIPVQAGDVIGKIGLAGPDNEPQVHFEIFTLDHSAVARADAKRQPPFWVLIPGVGDRRFCTQKAILDPIRKDHKIPITSEELLDYFRVEDHEATHHMVTNHYSEWAEKPNWLTELKAAPEYANDKSKGADIEELVNDQITPTLWWTDDLAQKLKLPFEAMIYTYHPISFIYWVNSILGVAKRSAASTGIKKATEAEIASNVGVKHSAMTDNDDKAGVGNFNPDELDPVGAPKIELKDMLEGYGD